MAKAILNRILSNPSELEEFVNALEKASCYMMISFKDICGHETIGNILSCHENLQLLRDALLEEYYKKVNE
jgi:hypothetical protein